MGTEIKENDVRLNMNLSRKDSDVRKELYKL